MTHTHPCNMKCGLWIVGLLVGLSSAALHNHEHEQDQQQLHIISPVDEALGILNSLSHDKPSDSIQRVLGQGADNEKKNSYNGLYQLGRYATNTIRTKLLGGRRGHGTRPSSSVAQMAKLNEAVRLLETAVDDENLKQSESVRAIEILADLNFFGNYSYPRNFGKALGYYESLAGDDSRSQFMCGVMYSTGVIGNIPINQAKAQLYYYASALNGNSQAQMALAYRMANGIGTKKDIAEAVVWYTRAALAAREYLTVDETVAGPIKTRHMPRNTDVLLSIPEQHGGVYGIRHPFKAEQTLISILEERNVGLSDIKAEEIVDTFEYLVENKNRVVDHYALAALSYEGGPGIERNYKTAVLHAKRGLSKVYDMQAFKQGKFTPIADKTLTSQDILGGALCAGFLGERYLRGEGVNYEPEIAIRLFELGEESQDPLSSRYLGILYSEGELVPHNEEKGLKLLQAAAKGGDIPAQVILLKLYLELPQDKRQQFADRQTLTGYLSRALSVGNIDGALAAAEFSLNNSQFPTAVAALKKASEMAKTPDSPIMWAQQQYSAGDVESAVLGFLIAAEQGFLSAQINVAYLLDPTGNVIDLSSHFENNQWMKNYPSASEASLVYYTRAGKAGYADALVKMGDFHLYGIGTVANQSNPERAARCYTAADEKTRHNLAIYNIGWMHEHGIGFARDFHLAKRYYDLALEVLPQNYLAVKLSLARLYIRWYWNYFRGDPSLAVTEVDEPQVPLRQQIRNYWHKWRDMKWAEFIDEEDDEDATDPWHDFDMDLDWVDTEGDDTLFVLYIVLAVCAFAYLRLRRMNGRNNRPNGQAVNMPNNVVDANAQEPQPNVEEEQPHVEEPEHNSGADSDNQETQVNGEELQQDGEVQRQNVENHETLQTAQNDPMVLPEADEVDQREEQQDTNSDGQQ